MHKKTIGFPGDAITGQAIFEAFTNVRRGKSVDSKALNKPLMLLFMLGKYWNNFPRLHLFKDVHHPFREILKEFSNQKIGGESTIYPFWHLSSSTLIWTLVGQETVCEWITPKGKKRRPSPWGARNSALLGGFTEQVYRRIINDKVMLLEITFAVLNEYFPNKTHLPLLHAIGIPSLPTKPCSFEDEILRQYRYTCSICDFPGTSNKDSTDLQIAFIKPARNGGPLDSPENCITMCDMHRNQFEYGNIAISKNGTILVSKEFRKLGGNNGLLAYQDKKASFPDELIYRPNRDYLTWHRDRIFDR